MKRMRQDGQVLNSTSTHRENTSPPIFDLPHDVLRTIVSLNVQHVVDLEQSGNGFSVLQSPNSDDPLLTTRRASQVCRQWRDAILSSPTLWGKALDLNSLAAGKPEWRTEVLKRTGNAPLTVVGQMFSRQKFPVSFLETIVLCHWSRIKALIIIRYHSFRTNGNAHFDKIIHNVLTRPAPNLQNCIIIDTNDNYARVVGDQIDPLFGGQAPKLQSMTLLTDSCFDGSKLSNLRRFYLLWTHLYPVDVILTALAGMPLLEELELEWDPDAGLTKQRTVRSSVIELRQLRKIALYNSFKWLGHLVQWVVPKHGCTLFHYVTDSCDVDTNSTTVEILESGREAYTTFLGRYLDATELTELSYTMECGNEDESPCLEIKARRKKTIHPELRVNEDGDEYPLFFTYVNKTLPTIHYLGPILSFFRRALSSCDLSNIKILTFSMSLENAIDRSHGYKELIAREDNAIMEFFNMLSGVNELVVSLDELEFLSSLLSRTPFTMLPQLKTINLIGLTYDDGYSLERFLVEREKHKAKPIETIYLGEEEADVWESFMETLSKLKDVSIIWKEKSNTGEPI